MGQISLPSRIYIPTPILTFDPFCDVLKPLERISSFCGKNKSIHHWLSLLLLSWISETWEMGCEVSLHTTLLERFEDLFYPIMGSFPPKYWLLSFAVFVYFPLACLIFGVQLLRLVNNFSNCYCSSEGRSPPEDEGWSFMAVVSLADFRHC